MDVPMVYYKSSAIRILKKFSNEEKKAFHQSLVALTETPEAGGFLKGTLQGLRKWKYRIRGVPYRIVYHIQNESIVIVALGKRKDFYDTI